MTCAHMAATPTFPTQTESDQRDSWLNIRLRSVRLSQVLVDVAVKCHALYVRSHTPFYTQLDASDLVLFRGFWTFAGYDLGERALYVPTKSSTFVPKLEALRPSHGDSVVWGLAAIVDQGVGHCVCPHPLRRKGRGTDSPAGNVAGNRPFPTLASQGG